MRQIFLILLPLLFLAACQEEKKPQRFYKLSDHIDTTWINVPSDPRHYYSGDPIQPLDFALWGLVQARAMTIEDGWLTYVFARRGRRRYGKDLLDPAWTYAELLQRAKLARPLIDESNGVRIKIHAFELDTTQVYWYSVVDFSLMNLLSDTVVEVTGFISLGDNNLKEISLFTQLIYNDTLAPNEWGKTVRVIQLELSPADATETNAEFEKRKQDFRKQWSHVLANPSSRRWRFNVSSRIFINDCQDETYGFESTRKFELHGH